MVNIAVIPPGDQLFVLLAAVLGATIWNLITWWLGLPTSSSHALVGAYAGGAISSYIFYNGFNNVETVLKAEGWIKTLSFIVLSPLIGMTLGFIMMVSVYWIFRKFSLHKVDKGFRVGQLFSAAAYSLGHGGNDAQKTMGIITIVLVSGGFLQMTVAGKLPEIPLWVVLSAHAAIGLGTLSGGWRIVKTMGTKIVKLQPVGGFCAETAGALTSVRRDGSRHSGFDNAYHHRLDRRRRIGKAILRRQMGRRRTHRLGMGPDDSRSRLDRSFVVRHYFGDRKAPRREIVLHNIQLKR